MGGDPILPIPGAERKARLITSALPYVNNVPHLGNIIGSVLSADVFARYCRARGFQTLYVCGSDEYGTATATKALEEGVTPSQLCDKYHKVHAEIYEWFQLSFDIFGRTPTPAQTEIVQDIFLKLWNNGYISEQVTTQPFCTAQGHNAFLADRFVEGECSICHYADARGDQCDGCGNLLDPLKPEKTDDEEEDDDPAGKATGWLLNPRCKVDGTTPVPRATEHLFIRLDLLRDDIAAWADRAKEIGGWSANCQQITHAWINKGLRPRAITRDLKWGVSIPKGVDGLDEETYKDKVFYVWFDAPIGYVSITKCYTDGDNPEGRKWEQWWKNPENVSLYQFMGKDNAPFHTVLFPGSQIGTKENWTKVNSLSLADYLNYEGGKFSKSRGVGVFGNTAKDTGISSDVWRFYLLSRRPETNDSEFKWQEFVDANNNDLLKNPGNLINRVLKFCESRLDSTVPDYTKYTSDALEAYKEEVDKFLAAYISALERQKLRAGLSEALHISGIGNKILSDNKFDGQLLAKEPEKCAAVIGLVLHIIHLVAGLLFPYMPGTSKSILTQLGLEPTACIPDQWDSATIKPGHRLGKPELLFKNIDKKQVDVWREAYGGEEAAALAAAKKAKKESDKEKRRLQKAAAAAAAAGDNGTPATAGGGSAERGEKEVVADPDVEKVTEALEKTEVHTP